MAPSDSITASQEAAVWIVERTSNEEELKSDERLVRDWVKNELWEKVVFLWNLKSLAPGGLLHASYISSCRHLLAKGKLMSMPDTSAKNYMNILWDRMTKNKSYNTWLGQKRSNTLQALQDRFHSKFITHSLSDSLCTTFLLNLLQPCACMAAELCEDCKDSNQILPSLESFNKRMLLPKVHFVFYDYFLRGVIGEKTWKLRIQDDSKELAAIAAEAYANLQLNNNYFAWLYEYMYAHPNSSLVTEYDAVLDQPSNGEEERGQELQNEQPTELFSGDVDLLEIAVPASYAAANAGTGSEAIQATSDASEGNEEQPREDFKVLLPVDGDEEPSAEIRAAKERQQNVANSIKERINADRTGNGDGSTRFSAYKKMRQYLIEDRPTDRRAAKQQSRKSKKNLRDFTKGPRKSKKGSDEILGWSVQGKLYMQKMMEKIQREGRRNDTGGTTRRRTAADSGIRRKWESTYRDLIKFSAPSNENHEEGDGEDFQMDETVMYAGIATVAV